VTVHRELAWAKINLSLRLGPVRPSDGRHLLVTLFSSLRLADALTIEAGGGRDEVVCDAVPGRNLVADALAGLRAAGWDAPAVRVMIDKRIPLAAGMGGGSADAAAMLRAAHRLAPVPAGAVAAIAARLGADVPAQLHPGASLAVGAGEIAEPVVDLAAHGVVVVPQRFGLSSADVYREADRLGLPGGDLHAARRELAAALPGPLADRLVVNDLEAAALSLAPEIARARGAVAQAGVDRALVCGSGPTVIGVCWGSDGVERAARAAARLRARFPGVVNAAPLARGVGEPSSKP